MTLCLNTNFSDINRVFQKSFGCRFRYRNIMIEFPLFCHDTNISLSTAKRKLTLLG